MQLDLIGEMGRKVLGDATKLPGSQTSARDRRILGCVQPCERKQQRDRQGIAIELASRFVVCAFLGEQLSQMHDARIGEHQLRRPSVDRIDLVLRHARQCRDIELQREVTKKTDVARAPVRVQTRRDEAERTVMRGRSTAKGFRSDVQVSADLVEHDGQHRPFGPEVHMERSLAPQLCNMCGHPGPRSLPIPRQASAPVVRRRRVQPVRCTEARPRRAEHAQFETEDAPARKLGPAGSHPCGVHGLCLVCPDRSPVMARCRNGQGKSIGPRGHLYFGTGRPSFGIGSTRRAVMPAASFRQRRFVSRTARLLSASSWGRPPIRRALFCGADGRGRSIDHARTSHGGRARRASGGP